MENPKISIIVPVYKAESYLRRCVDSLLAQTFRDFEVILVDDGSPDKSGEMCDEYARQDARVRVIHQLNTGVSLARQKGLDNAKGEYVIHGDPDDWVEPEMLEQLYAKAMEEDADMVICDFYINLPGQQVYRCQRPSSLHHNVVQCELFSKLHGSCWNKLVRRDCFNRYHVQFPEGISCWEDLLTNAALLAHDIKVTYLPKAFYHYDNYSNDNSIVHIYSRKRFDETVRLVRIMGGVLKGSAAEKIARDTVCSEVLIVAFYGHFFSSMEYRKKCKPYRKYCFARKGMLSIRLYASCIGLYRVVYRLWQLKQNIRRIIKTRC